MAAKQEITPNYYKAQGGEEFTIAQIKEMTTEEGIKAYYKSIGMAAFATKKAVATVIECNTGLLTNTDTILNEKLTSIKTYIAADQPQAEW